MRITVPTLLTLLALATSASAQDGGRIPWRGKDDAKGAMAEAKRQNRPMMLYFTSVG